MFFTYFGKSNELAFDVEEQMLNTFKRTTFTRFINRVGMQTVAEIFPEYDWPVLGMSAGSGMEMHADYELNFYCGELDRDTVMAVNSGEVYYLFTGEE